MHGLGGRQTSLEHPRGNRLKSVNGNWYVLLSLAVLAPFAAEARGPSPYLPLNMSPEIERQIESVLILAGKPVLKRPIAAAAVLDALPRACEVDAVLCQHVRSYLATYMRSFGVVAGSLEVAAADGDSVSLPNQRGLNSDSVWSVSAQAQWQPNDHVLVALGGYGNEAEAKPTGSMLSVGWEFAQLDVGFRDHWFSPLIDSSMLVSTNAPTMPSVTLSNYTPISRLGLGYELFLGELSKSDLIAFGGGYTSGNPRVAGLHVSIEPASGFSLAASRIVQFGGGERGGTSVGDFFDALVKPYESDNLNPGLTQDEEFGNQQAAFTSQFIFPGSVPFTVYFEYAGEDTSYDADYRLGNASLSAGIRFPRLWRFVDLVYEVSEWQNAWYASGIYGDGPTNDGRVIGHWGGDYRVFRDSVGAQAHFLSLGWLPPFGGAFQLSYRTVENESYSTFDYQRAHTVGLQYSRAISGFTVGGEISGGEDTLGRNFARFAAFARFGAQWSDEGGSGWFEKRSRERGADLFVDAGYNVTELHVLRGDVTASLKTKMGYEGGMNFGLGARRAVSERSDLGARVELSEVHGDYLFAVRALDYRYRLNHRWAITAFLGAARYETGLPAYGYYLGAGAQWRNILPNVDLGLDLRYADKVARDKLLPSDPPSSVRPDIFYDMYGAVVSLSYRW